MVLQNQEPLVPFRGVGDLALSTLFPVSPEQWWSYAERLLYTQSTINGNEFGHFRLTLSDLDDMYWGDLPGQIIWWDQRLTKHHEETKRTADK